MIKAYLVGISTQYEGEDIEVRYCIFEDEELLCKKSVMLGYEKPAIVGHVSMITILKELEKYKDKEIVIIINGGALYESIMGTSGTKNKDVLEMAKEVRRRIKRFTDIDIRNVSGNHIELAEWDEILRL